MRFQYFLALASLAMAAPLTMEKDGTLAEHIAMLPKQLDAVLAAVTKFSATASFDPVDSAADDFTEMLEDTVKAAQASPKLSAADAKAVVAALTTTEAHLKPAFAAITAKKAAFVSTKNAAHIKEDIEATAKGFQSIVAAVNAKGGAATPAGNLIAADIAATLKVY